MTGVASRNEKFADSSWSSPPESPATIVTPLREMPANRARICDEPMAKARAGRIGSSRLYARVAPARRSSRSPTSRITPLIVRKIAAASGLAKSTRNLCSSSDARDADGHVPTARTKSSR